MPKLKFLEEKEELNFFDEDEDIENEIEPNANREAELKEISKIVVSGSDWTTATILDQIVRGNIQLNPRFQRRDAWKIPRKSKFIESIILGFPIPHIVLAYNEKERGKFIVLDGKQRLLTILQFYGKSETKNNSFALKGLEFRPDLNGYRYEEIKEDFFKNDVLDLLDNQPIRTTLIRNWKSDSLLYQIFLRLNVENTPLFPQELRQALHPGDFINFLDDHSLNSLALRKVLKSQSPDVRMRDVELLLRYVAFHYFLSEYRGQFKAFLDMTCEKLNKNWPQKYDEIKNVISQFDEAVQTTINIFGEENISRPWLIADNKYGKRNTAVLDVMVFYFSDEWIRESAEKNTEQVVNTFKELCSQDQFREALGATRNTTYATHTRLSLWGKALLKVLDVEFNVPELVENRIIFNGLR
jgi:hypothetical protein